MKSTMVQAIRYMPTKNYLEEFFVSLELNMPVEGGPDRLHGEGLSLLIIRI